MSNEPRWTRVEGVIDLLIVGDVTAVVMARGCAGLRWCWLVGAQIPDAWPFETRQGAETHDDAMRAAERYLGERGLLTAHDLARLASARANIEPIQSASPLGILATLSPLDEGEEALPDVPAGAPAREEVARQLAAFREGQPEAPAGTAREQLEEARRSSAR